MRKIGYYNTYSTEVSNNNQQKPVQQQNNNQQKPVQQQNNNHKQQVNNSNNQNTVKPSHKINAQDINNKKKNIGKTIIDTLKEIPAKADNVNKRFSLWKRNAKNAMFYRKYLDRIHSGLYERYAGEAVVKESKMVGDPVEILKNQAQKYIQSIVKDVNKLYKKVLEMSNELSEAITSDMAIKIIERYCKDYISENSVGGTVDQNKLAWKVKILNATKYKIAKILFSHRDTGIYGYTAKNCVLKGFPKPNHLIVTLFVANPEEVPQEQSVTDIFQSVDSFDILAQSEKTDIFNVSNMVHSAMSESVDNNVMNEIKNNKTAALKAFANSNTIANKKEEGRVIDDIWDGINASCRELLGKKAYFIDCINVYFDMILRIDKLAKTAIDEILMVENKYRDTRYDSSLNISHKRNTNNKYIDDENDPRSAKYRQNKIEKRKETAKQAVNVARQVNRLNG